MAGAGTFLAWRILGSWAGFVETAYGRLLLTKIGIALVVAAHRRLEPLAHPAGRQAAAGSATASARPPR